MLDSWSETDFDDRLLSCRC